ncbi:MAG: hypothetical protein PHD54_03795, partial [Desulfuromonadaceae bacterium]|nr:hypothetical protein [Desulfuromonadaceae bacterium]
NKRPEIKKMPNPRKTTAISLLACALLLLSIAAYAGQAATVTHLSGPLAARKADGAVNNNKYYQKKKSCAVS